MLAERHRVLEPFGALLSPVLQALSQTPSILTVCNQQHSFGAACVWLPSWFTQGPQLLWRSALSRYRVPGALSEGFQGRLLYPALLKPDLDATACNYNVRSWPIAFSASKLLTVARRLEKATDALPGAGGRVLCLLEEPSFLW